VVEEPAHATAAPARTASVVIMAVKAEGVAAVVAAIAAAVMMVSSKHVVSILFRYIETIDISDRSKDKSLFRYI
jgi:hypothetical protein